MDNWKEVKLSDVTSILGDGIHGTPNYSDDGHYYFINGNNLCEGKIIFKQDTKRVSESEYLKYKKPLNNRTLLFSINGTVGNVAKYNGEPCILGKSACYFNIIEEVDKDYIYYVVSSPSFIQSMSSLANGTTIKNVSLKQMREKEFLLPPIETQRKISAMLSAIDKKIDINQRICRNIEEQAQAIFKSWFIDFDPFKNGKFVDSELGLIPEGWKIGALIDILDNIKETTKQGENPDLPYLPIDSIPMKSFLVEEVKDNSEAQSSLILFKKLDILVGAMRVYFHRVIPAPFDGITRSTCFVLRPKVPYYYAYALCCVNSNQAIKHAEKTSKGTTMPYAVWEGGLGAFNIVIPPKSVAEAFDSLIKKDIEMIHSIYFENQTLKSLRDALLPKLMSGQITL
jgi:type I restriction enzyme S subunit